MKLYGLYLTYLLLKYSLCGSSYPLFLFFLSNKQEITSQNSNAEYLFQVEQPHKAHSCSTHEIIQAGIKKLLYPLFRAQVRDREGISYSLLIH